MSNANIDFTLKKLRRISCDIFKLSVFGKDSSVFFSTFSVFTNFKILVQRFLLSMYIGGPYICIACTIAISN